MPSYTTLTAAARTRIMRVTRRGAVPVTSVPDPDTAQALAAALTDIGTDVPGVAAAVMTAAGVHVPDPDVEEYADSAALRNWLRGPAPTAALDLTRRALSALDAHEAPFDALARALTPVPEPVSRAVRQEIAHLLSDYDDVPVLAHVYDRKGNEVNWVVVVTGALNRAPQVAVERIIATGDGGELLDILERDRDLEIPASVIATADQGYLRVDLHLGQLAAWRAHHRADPGA